MPYLCTQPAPRPPDQGSTHIDRTATPSSVAQQPNPHVPDPAYDHLSAMLGLRPTYRTDGAARRRMIIVPGLNIHKDSRHQICLRRFMPLCSQLPWLGNGERGRLPLDCDRFVQATVQGARPTPRKHRRSSACIFESEDRKTFISASPTVTSGTRRTYAPAGPVHARDSKEHVHRMRRPCCSAA